MDLIEEIRKAKSDPQKLEQLYQTAQNEGQTDFFQSALLTCYEETPNPGVTNIT